MRARELTCPACQTPLGPEATACPVCGADLAAAVYLQRQADVLYNAGLRAARVGDVAKAILLLEQCVRGDVVPGSGRDPEEWPQPALALLGKLYARQGQWEQARRAWQQALRAAPGNLAAQQGLAYLAELEANETQAARQAELAESQKQADAARRNRSRAVVLASLAFVCGLACMLAWQRLGPGGPAASPGEIAAVSATPFAPDTTAAMVSSSLPATDALPAPTGAFVAFAATAEPTDQPTATPASSPVPTPTAAPTPTATATVPDLRAPVQAAMKTVLGSDAAKIQVEQHGNVILLRGQVPSVMTRYQLEEAVRGAPGVANVDLQYLKVAPTYRVEAGDTLWSISQAVYGTPYRWLEIAQANNLNPPYWSPIGQDITIPLP
jgi:nucleoid-associated protein YgaU